MAVRTYIIAAGDSFVKIGMGSSPYMRCKEIQSHCPLPLKIVVILQGDHEQHLHTKFKIDRLHGEWFTYSPQIKAFVAEYLYTGEQPGLTEYASRYKYHGNKNVPLSTEHRAAISAAFQKRKLEGKTLVPLDDLPKNSPLYRKRVKVEVEPEG
jgi:hypothetical protein